MLAMDTCHPLLKNGSCRRAGERTIAVTYRIKLLLLKVIVNGSASSYYVNTV